MSIEKKSLTRAASPKLKQDDSASGPKGAGRQAANAAENKRLTVAKLATAKLSIAKLVTLKKLS